MRFKIFVVVVLVSFLIGTNTLAVSKNNSGEILNNLINMQILPSTIGKIKSPDIKTPNWLQAQIDAEQAITANLSEFKAQANQTLNDPRGWSRLGISFQEVASGGNFTLVLSEASQVPRLSSICSDYWSCQVGSYVIINQTRWLYASPAWTGSLRDYRHMVINHETGHWLGHGHIFTCGAGNLAPVMMQQSISLNGCNFNPWPLDSELWANRTGNITYNVITWGL